MPLDRPSGAEEAGRRGDRRLRLDQGDPIRTVDQQIGLDAVAIPIEREPTRLPLVGPLLGDLGNDPCLACIGFQAGGGLDATSPVRSKNSTTSSRNSSSHQGAIN